jgi:hypothetical protein
MRAGAGSMSSYAGKGVLGLAAVSRGSLFRTRSYQGPARGQNGCTRLAGALQSILRFWSKNPLGLLSMGRGQYPPRGALEPAQRGLPTGPRPASLARRWHKSTKSPMISTIRAGSGNRRVAGQCRHHAYRASQGQQPASIASQSGCQSVVGYFIVSYPDPVPDHCQPVPTIASQGQPTHATCQPCQPSPASADRCTPCQPMHATC